MSKDNIIQVFKACYKDDTETFLVAYPGEEMSENVLLEYVATNIRRRIDNHAAKGSEHPVSFTPPYDLRLSNSSTILCYYEPLSSREQAELLRYFKK